MLRGVLGVVGVTTETETETEEAEGVGTNAEAGTESEGVGVESEEVVGGSETEEEEEGGADSEEGEVGEREIKLLDLKVTCCKIGTKRPKKEKRSKVCISGFAVAITD